MEHTESDLLDADFDLHTFDVQSSDSELLACDSVDRVSASNETLRSSSPMSLSEEGGSTALGSQHMINEDSTSHCHGFAEEEVMEYSDEGLQAGTIEDEIWFNAADQVDDHGSVHGSIIDQIESIFESIADGLLAERKELSMNLRERRHAKSGGGHASVRPQSRSSTFTFPGKSAEEAWRFSVVVRILELMHETILAGQVMTKRDLYYRDPALFGKQSVVNRYVDQISNAFGVPRNSVNITAAAKGLMSGAITLHRRDGSSIDLRNSSDGFLIPGADDILSVDMAAIRCVFVIEKEATFQSVLSSEKWQTLHWQSVIMTGKGYPDLATRAMLRLITRATPQNGFITPRIYGLMDFDPDGLSILGTYKHGSINLRAENHSLVVPEIQWLGLHSKHIMDAEQTHQSQGLMPLTKRDRRKARNMLEQDCMNTEVEWRRQLQVMLMLNIKAELQILDAAPGALMDVIANVVQ